jgi:hypothetical protein
MPSAYPLLWPISGLDDILPLLGAGPRGKMKSRLDSACLRKRGEPDQQSGAHRPPRRTFRRFWHTGFSSWLRNRAAQRIGAAPATAALVTLFLAGCSAQLLEDTIDIGEFNAPRPCNEPMKLFNTFSINAKKIAWKNDRGDAGATLTVNMVVNNDKHWPIALSNSTQGVLYTVEYTLRGEKGGNFSPQEASGILLARPPREFKEPARTPPFGQPKRSGSTSNRTKQTEESAPDINFRIRPGMPEEGMLVFQAPRDRYLLVIERKFTGRSVSNKPSDHIAVCKILPTDTASLNASVESQMGLRVDL